MAEKNSILEKGPGDVSEKPRVPKFRGEDGLGGTPKSSKNDSESVEYKR